MRIEPVEFLEAQDEVVVGTKVSFYEYEKDVRANFLQGLATRGLRFEECEDSVVVHGTLTVFSVRAVIRTKDIYVRSPISGRKVERMNLSESQTWL